MTVFQFRPNWQQPYVETYEFLTEILVSESGVEQRRAWRDVARRSVSYRAMPHHVGLRDFRAQMVNQGDPVTFPDVVRRTRTVGEMAAGATTLTVTSVPAWLTAGVEVIVEDRLTHLRRARTILSVVGSVVTFDDVSAFAWASGSRIMPSLTGRVASNLRYTASTDEVLVTPVTLDVEPGSEPSQATTPGALFNGREVLAHRPNWREPVTIQADDPTEFVDYGFGVRHAARRIEFQTTVFQSEHLTRGADDLNQVLGLFLRCRGRQGEFYAPSWLNDIVLLEPVAVGASVFAVAGHAFHDIYAADVVHRAFAVRLADGSLRYFRIASMAKSTSGQVRTLITTHEASDAAINPATVRAVSWMPVCRFASDEMTVSWLTDQTAEIAANIQTVGLIP